MYANPVAYVFSCIFVLIAHIAMLLNVYFNGNYTEVRDVAVLGAAVLILDISYFVVILLFKQTSYVLDFLLILVLNMSFIFQSCFGKVGFDVKPVSFASLHARQAISFAGITSFYRTKSHISTAELFL